MPDLIVPIDKHNDIATQAYLKRGFSAAEADAAACFSELTARHGIRTHNLIKALHLDHLFGTGNKKLAGCVPNATIIKRPSRFDAAAKWDAQRKLGQAVAYEAIAECEKLADKFGVGMVSVDHAFHYLWGGGYVLESAKRGYIAYTCCTAALAEVVPFGGRYPTLGTNPHSWAFPTTDAVGFPVVVDWATSAVAMGRVQQFLREGKQLPPGAAVDEHGNPTTDPNAVKALLPFGAHKGYGLSLINELVGAFIGGSLPTLRSRPNDMPANVSDEKTTPNFFFQVIHPEAMSCGAFARGRNQAANVKAVVEDILGHGNAPPEGGAILPGKIEHDAAMRTDRAGGLLFSEAEVDALSAIADEAGVAFDTTSLKPFNE